MRTLAVLLTILGVNVAVYFLFFTDSEAYAAYQTFDNHRLHLRYDACEALASSDQVEDLLDDLRRQQRKMGEARWYKYQELNNGPFRKLVEETTGPDGRVTLKIVQEILRGPPEIVALSPRMNVRETHTVVLLPTEEGWRVDELTIDEDILEPLPRDW